MRRRRDLRPNLSFRRLAARRRRAIHSNELRLQSENALDEATYALQEALFSFREVTRTLYVDSTMLKNPRSAIGEIEEAVREYDYGTGFEAAFEQFSSALKRSVELHNKAVDLSHQASELEDQEYSAEETEKALEFEDAYFGR